MTAKEAREIYQRAMNYAAWAKGEIWRPLLLMTETFTATTFLATVLNYRVPPKLIIAAYFILFAVFIAVGKLLAVVGVIDYNNQIANKQNPEIMEIIERLKRIEEKLKDN